MNEGSAGSAPALSNHDRAALLRKYRLLAIWRGTKDGAVSANAMALLTERDAGQTDGAPETSPRALRTLAREFPGALRELDVLGISELSRRIVCLERILSKNVGAGQATGEPAGGRDQDEPWIAWIFAYHQLMRAALIIKRAAGPRRHVAESALPHLLAQARATCALPIDEDFARAVIRPASGRVGVIVMTQLGRIFAVSATEISHTLFPPRRPPPYALTT